MTYDWYSMYFSGSTLPSNVCRIFKPAFTRFIDDIGVVRKGSQSHSMTAFQQCFLQVIAKELREIGAQTDATDAAEANSLDRMEFMQCLVRVADLACLKTQLAPDIAAAVGMLLQETVAPVILKAFKFALSRPQVYTNIFRRLNCYTRDCTTTIEEHMPTVKGLFDRYCMSENDGADSGLRSSMSFDEFNIFIRDFHLLDHLFSARECTLAFVWSRLRVIDDGKSKRGRLHLYNLSQECFYEVLVRIAMMKSLPTDMELGYAGFEDAGSFFAELGKKPEVLRQWRDEHRSDWDVDWEDDDYDPRQPSHRALSHLLELIVYQVETYLAGGGPKGGEPPPTFDPCAPLTTRKIDKWYKSRLDARSGAKK